MKTKNVIVLPYDPQWVIEFEKLRAFLSSVCGNLIVEIHHVGSTSVVGLAAKPILDVDIEIKSHDDFEAIKEKLAAVGYTHEGDLDIPGREAFKVDTTSFMTHHLYVCASGASELKRHLAFRDYLRTHLQDRDLYGEIKQQAALSYPQDIDGYMKEKSTLITKLYALLEKEGKI